jgi:hypothetical protein
MNLDTTLLDRIANGHGDNDRLSVESRLDQFMGVEPSQGDARLKPEKFVPIEEVGETSIPETQFESLSVGKLNWAMKTSGALIVRGMLEPRDCREYRPIIDKILKQMNEAHTARVAGEEKVVSPFNNPPENLEKFVGAPGYLDRARGFHRGSGSAMCIESPSLAEHLLELYGELNLRPLLQEYFGELPCVSAQKWVLRRSKMKIHEGGWHQDGAFMGPDIKSLNLWISLSRCGSDSGAPGMDIVPEKLERFIEAGEAAFDWVADPGTLLSDGKIAAPVSPNFQPGDAIFFDHWNLHRTQYLPEFVRRRYAIETWFFGEKYFPKNQIPLAW